MRGRKRKKRNINQLRWARARRYEKLAEKHQRKGNRKQAKKYSKMAISEERKLPKDFHEFKMKITRK